MIKMQVVKASVMCQIGLSFTLALLIICSPCVASAAKYAFVVGIANYGLISALKTPTMDARKVSEKLTILGYKVTLVVDPDTTRETLILKWGQFLTKLDQGDDAIVYYSGHGVEIHGANYLVPRDVPKADTIRVEASLKSLLISVDDWMQDIKDRQVALAVLILDACRENPFTFDTKTLGGVGGLTTPGPRLGQFIFYAASAHETALDAKSGQDAADGSIFTRVFLEQFDSYKHHELRDFAAALKKPVENLASPHPQHPTYEDGLDDPWCFDGCGVAQASVGVLASGGGIATVSSTMAVASIVRSTQANTTSITPLNTPQNAIFLGKNSSLPIGSQDCSSKITDALPFGCHLLQQIATSESGAQAPNFLHVPLRPETDVNIRKRIPTVNEKSQGAYSCIVGVLTPRETTKFSGVIKISYDGNQFYWGLLDRPPLDCAR